MNDIILMLSIDNKTMSRNGDRNRKKKIIIKNKQTAHRNIKIKIKKIIKTKKKISDEKS